MSATFISPDFTELKALRENLEIAKEFSIVPVGEKFQKITKRIYIDLTFDIFNKNITSAYLYRLFGDIEEMLITLEYAQVQFVLLKSYPFRSNMKILNEKQKIIHSFMQVLDEYYNARTFYIPTIISRHSFHLVHNPPVTVINAVRLEHTDIIKIKNSSRFFLIYEMDLLDTILKREEFDKNLIIEGIEMSLEEIYNRCQSVAGQSPLNFESVNFINYEYPEEAMESVNWIQYDFEDMLVDITSYLF